MTRFKKPFQFALCLIPVGMIAGFLCGRYQLDLLTGKQMALVLEQLGSPEVFLAVYTVQITVYTFICGFFGRILSEFTGLWRPLSFSKKTLLTVFLTAAAGGALYSLDYWLSGSVHPVVQTFNLQSQTLSGLLTSVLYGGIIEELMLRLFFMSLCVWILWKLFWRNIPKGKIPQLVFVLANIISAMLFAAGHLPATIELFGFLTPFLIIRCFILNGAAGMLFGWMYQKYGIQYAMVAHAVFHIISKLIWLVFVPIF